MVVMILMGIKSSYRIILESCWPLLACYLLDCSANWCVCVNQIYFDSMLEYLKLLQTVTFQNLPVLLESWKF